MSDLLPTETDLAFPCSMPTGIKDGHPLGFSKRELFAAIAMQGLVANTGTCGDTGAPHTIASRSVEVADALLKELAK